ncbi:hypothetical protein HY065_02670, partial [Candidatus Berkelbacteria bacterium]|nr:hypothetical protein [Candidatus Berkelbacteria bacterium]
MEQRTNIKNIFITLVLIAGFALPVSFAVGQSTPRGTQEAIALAITNLKNAQNPDGSIGDTDTSGWAAMALVAAGESNEKLGDYLLISAKTVSKNSATDLERTILALTAAGKNPYDVAGRNLVADLKTLV